MPPNPTGFARFAIYGRFAASGKRPFPHPPNNRRRCNMPMSLHPTRPKRPVLKYTGSKHRLAEWVVAHIPRGHDSYGEPFGGSAAVLTAKERSRMETYNDLSGDLVTFLITLRERPDELIAAIRATYYARQEFELSLQPTTDTLEQARRFYTRCWLTIRPFDPWPSFRRQKYVSRGKDGESSPMVPAAKQFAETDHLFWFAERLRGVAIENLPALTFIKDYDHPTAFFYVDPPYLRKTRKRTTAVYPHDEMADSDHEVLAEALRGIKGMAIVSGYAFDKGGAPNNLYARLYEDHGWQRVDTSARIDGGGIAVESLWLCPRTQAALAAERPTKPQQLSLEVGP